MVAVRNGTCENQRIATTELEKKPVHAIRRKNKSFKLMRISQRDDK
jgi:hypothetical protein